MDRNNPAVVLGLYIPGIAIIKHLSAHGIEVIGLSYIRNVPGFALKNARTLLIPSPVNEAEKLLQYLIRISKYFTSKPVVYNTSDDYLQFLHKYKDELSQHYLFAWEATAQALQLSSKLELVQTATEAGVPKPNTMVVEQLSEAHSLSETVQFPVLIKPLYANEWRTPDMKKIIGSNKVIRISSKEELDSWLNKLGNTKAKFMIQELIPGEDDELFYCVVLLARDGKIKRYFCGQKIRITPIHFGSASYVETVNAEPFIPMIEKLLTQINYFGPAGVEFKRDPRDDTYKLIEVNTRFGLWDDLCLDLGTDVFLAYYDDMTGQNPDLIKPLDKKVRWVSISRDIPDSYQYVKEHKLSVMGWIKTYLPPVKVAEWYEGEYILLFHLLFGKVIYKIRKIFNV